MNLYKHIFEHYSQKDSEEGTKEYFLAENDTEAYKKVYGDYDCQTVNQVIDEDSKYDDYDKKYYYYIDGQSYPNTLTEEEAREIVIKAKGEVNMEMDLEDLYYGRIYRGWALVKESLSPSDIVALKRLNIIKVEDEARE